jgi:hypothetical protein
MSTPPSDASFKSPISPSEQMELTAQDVAQGKLAGRQKVKKSKDVSSISFPKQEVSPSDFISKRVIKTEEIQISTWKKAKDAILKLLGFPVNLDKKKANEIKKNIKNLETHLNKYAKYANQKMRGEATTEFGNIKDLMAKIIQQAKELKTQEIDAKQLGKKYYFCRSLFKDIDKVHRYAQRFDYRTQIEDALQEIEHELKREDEIHPFQRSETLLDKEKKFIQTLNAAIKSEFMLKQKVLKKKVDKHLQGKPVTRENAYAIMKIVYPGLATITQMELNESKKEILAAKERFQIILKEQLQVLSETGIEQVNSQAAAAIKEIEELPESNKKAIEKPFLEFIETERRFKEQLEDLQIYKVALDHILELGDKGAREKLNAMGLEDLSLKAVKDLRSNLEKFGEILKVITKFSNAINHLKLEELPKFARNYLSTDFTAMLEIVSMQEQFNGIILGNPSIFQLCQQIKTNNLKSKGGKKFKNPLIDIDGVVSSVFQRIARYPLLLKELQKTTHTNILKKTESAIMNIVNLCHRYATGWAEAVNKW